jgi:hypothetical protein
LTFLPGDERNPRTPEIEITNLEELSFEQLVETVDINKINNKLEEEFGEEQIDELITDEEVNIIDVVSSIFVEDLSECERDARGRCKTFEVEVLVALEIVITQTTET